MAEYLLVIDMQTDYVADGKLYNQNQLVTAVNQKIAHYPSDRVIYVVNRFFWEINKESKKFVDGLSLVSNQVFEKRRISCFTNHYLKRFLEKNRAEPRQQPRTTFSAEIFCPCRPGLKGYGRFRQTQCE